MQQIAWGAIPGKRFSDLTRRPFGGRMRRHVEVNRVTPVMAYHHKYKQQAKAHGPSELAHVSGEQRSADSSDGLSGCN
jgi:hypothetical protein